MKLLIFLAALATLLGAVTGMAIDLGNSTSLDFESQSANLEKRSHNGYATVYTQQGGTGSCGHVHRDSDYVVSIAQHWYDQYGHDFLCGRKIKVKNTGHWTDNSVGGQGNIIYPKIADTCSICSADTSHVDLSVGAWNKLTNHHAYSTVKVHWYFCGIGGDC